MMTKQDAIRVAEEHLNSRPSGPRVGGERRIVDDEWTLERDYGWLFIYNTADFVHTRDKRHALVGNGPLLVKRDGSIIQFQSFYDREKALADYEANPEKFA